MTGASQRQWRSMSRIDRTKLVAFCCGVEEGDLRRTVFRLQAPGPAKRCSARRRLARFLTLPPDFSRRRLQRVAENEIKRRRAPMTGGNVRNPGYGDRSHRGPLESGAECGDGFST